MSRSVLRRSGFLRADRRGRSVASLLARGLAIGLLACAPMAGAQPVHAQEPPPIRADFLGLSASDDAHKMTDWILASGDNRGLPFLIVDKIAAKVFAFGATGDLRGAAPALLGLGIGDESAPDIGQRRLASITAAERTTAAGRFEAELVFDGPAPASLRRGQSVRVRVELGAPEPALLLPAGRYARSAADGLLVVSADGRTARRRPVTLGRQSPTHVEVLDGLAPGERVVTSSTDAFGDADVLLFQ